MTSRHCLSRHVAAVVALLASGATVACSSAKKGTSGPGDAAVDQAAGGTGGPTGAGGGAGAGGGGSGGGGTSGVDGSPTGDGGSGGGGGTGGCIGSTSISGTVWDPAGLAPLYNAIVYVPGAAVAAVPDGPSCDRCGNVLSGQPVAAGLSGADGKFHLDDVPPGANVPLVIQLGKWRRQVSIPSVAACVDNLITDANLTRLPRSSSEGHLPRIAVVTGHADALDCFLRRIGIADSEITSDAGTGRVHLYTGGNSITTQGTTQISGGETLSSAYTALYPDPRKLASYDMLLLACEGEQVAAGGLLSPAPYANLKAYADHGGRVIVEHAQSPWIARGVTPWPATAQWVGSGPDQPSPLTASIDTSFPRGAAFADWLTLVGASTTAGQITLRMVQDSVNAVFAPTQRWIYTTVSPLPPAAAAATPLLTFDTPVEAPVENQCGRVTFVDLHAANSAGASHPELPFPTGCTGTGPLSPEERVLEFMFFNAAGCVQADSAPPVAPGSGGGGPEPDVLSGKKALFVVDVPSALDEGDAALKADLETRGMTVTLATVDGPSSLAAGQDLVIGSGGAGAPQFATTFKDVAVPILVFGNGYDIPLGLAASGAASTGAVTSTMSLTVVGTGTPLTADLATSSTFLPIGTTRVASLYWGTPGGSPIRVAAVTGSPDQLLAFAFEKGAATAAGTAPQRRIALGWRANTFPNLAVPTYKLTIAALKWAATAPP